MGELALSALAPIVYRVITAGFSAATHHVRVVSDLRVNVVTVVVRTGWRDVAVGIVIAMCGWAGVVWVWIDMSGELCS